MKISFVNGEYFMTIKILISCQSRMSHIFFLNIKKKIDKMHLLFEFFFIEFKEKKSN